jgi:hypothetical protein
LTRFLQANRKSISLEKLEVASRSIGMCKVTSFAPSGALTATLPCNDLDASERFYNRLDFTRSGHHPPPGEADTYRMLSNGSGG